nr:uncharacterized protein LOC109154451 [Ipomoea batatas]
MYQGNNQTREEPPKESMEDKMVRMFSELRHDVTNMRQEWKQDLRQEISTIRQEVSNLRQESNASLRHLETQVAQNSKALAERPQGTLPSTTVNNPRERVQAVTLRSGKELPEPTLKKNTISKKPIEEEDIPPDAPLDARNIFSSPLSSMFGSPPPSPKGLPRAEMMVPRHTLERGEPSKRPNDDTSSEEGEAPMMEVAHRGLMIEVEDLFRYRHFRDKQIIEWNYIEAPVLAVLGIQREFERMTSQPFWSHICDWRDATYVPIVREFIATLGVNESVHNRRQPSIRFKLFNRQYNLSSDELGNLLGFYTLHDQDQGWYANLVDDFPNEHQPGLFWWSIARQGVAWRPSYTSAKYIKAPELKIMWHIVARSWLGRQSPNDNVTSRELFILWSIYTGTPIHMGELCKTFLKRQSYEDSESIFVGPIVSRLCEALGFEDALAYEAVATTMTPLDIGDFLQFGIAPEEPSEDEERGEQRDLWGIIERLENRVNMLEHEVRRLKFEWFGEESDGSGI